MTIECSEDMRAAIDLGWEMGGVMRDYFGRPDLASERKGDGSLVTEADMFVSNYVIGFYRARNRGVVSEEVGRTAEYGDPDAEYLDPIDGTHDFSEGRMRKPRLSIAAFSLGSVLGGEIMRGVVNLPLLSSPRLLWAERGRGAFCLPERNGRAERLRVDATARKGIILVSERRHTYADFIEAHGLRTVGFGGIVFKACAVADPRLMETQKSVAMRAGEQVIGFVSDSASAHDYAAAAIVREAGGLACGMDGGPLRLGSGKQGCIFANNQATRDLLIESLRA